MSCCDVNILPFLDKTATVLPFTGNEPTVSVYYLQEDGSFQMAGIFTQIIYGINSITIDHGGTSTGYVKIIQ